MTLSIWKLVHRVAPYIAVAALALAMGGTWTVAPATASPNASLETPSAPPARTVPSKEGTSPRVTGAASATGSSGTGRADSSPRPPVRRGTKKELAGTLNLNAATVDQLMMLPTIGPSKAERIVTWRKRNGGFKRIADLRRVKGFGYKTFKRLERFLSVSGDTTLVARP